MSTRTRTSIATGSLALLLAVAACSSEGEAGDAGPAAGTAVPTTAATSAGFATPQDVIAAMEENGLPCEEPQSGTYEGVSQAASCIVGGSEDVVILRFATPAEKQDYLANKDELASVVLGDHWAVQTVLRETADKVAAAIGGEVRPGSS